MNTALTILLFFNNLNFLIKEKHILLVLGVKIVPRASLYNMNIFLILILMIVHNGWYGVIYFIGLYIMSILISKIVVGFIRPNILIEHYHKSDSQILLEIILSIFKFVPLVTIIYIIVAKYFK